MGSWLEGKKCGRKKCTQQPLKVSFAFHLETKVLESAGRVEMHRIQVQYEVSAVMIWVVRHLLVLGVVGLLCFIKSEVNAATYHEISERFVLKSSEKLYGDADCRLT